MPLYGYFDESGTHGGHLLTCVAGFLFDDDGLVRFRREWLALTNELVGPFHTTDCVHGRGQFAGWPEPQRLLLLHNLAEVIARSRRAGFIASVEQHEFDIWAKRDSMVRHVRSAYSLCLLGCIEMVAQYLEQEGVKDRVHYCFESGSDKQREASEFLRQAKTNVNATERLRIASYSFASKQREAVLCAADFLSWEWQRNMVEYDQDERANRASFWRSEFKVLIDAAPHLLFKREYAAQNLNFRTLVSVLKRYT